MFFPSGSAVDSADGGAWEMMKGACDVIDGAWGFSDGALGSLVEDGFSEDADRNMSCHAGVVAVFGSEYGTISIVMKHAQRREKMDLICVYVYVPNPEP